LLDDAAKRKFDYVVFGAPHRLTSEKRDYQSLQMSAFHPKADIRRGYWDVRFVP
jgi:hypothetical protein